MKPFLLITTRAEEAAADNEYAAFLSYMGLDESGLIRHRLERHPLGEIDLASFSGILLGGSPFNSTDPAESKSSAQLRAEADLHNVMDRVIRTDFPLLGACYGISAVGGHQGAVLDREYAEPVGAVTITLTDQGLRDPLLAGLPGAFDAFVGHKEAISSLPAHCVLLASSSTCRVQMFRVGRNVYATQFHPELDVEGLCTRIEVYKHAGYFPPEQAEVIKTMARASHVVDPPAILQAFVNRYGRADLPPSGHRPGNRGASAPPAVAASAASRSPSSPNRRATSV